MEQTIFEQYPILGILTYLITAIGGGVLFKYLQAWLGYKKDSADTKQTANQKLIENLQGRIDSITERQTELERQREKAHEREIERSKQLFQAEARVSILQDKIVYLEKALSNMEKIIEKYKDIIEKYKDQYGELK